jgi:exopolysaccharide production protein ExoQ
MNTERPQTGFQLPELRRSVYLTALVVGAAFFMTEHNIYNSLANDYTQSAEEMLATAEGGNTLRRLAFLALAAFGVGLFVVTKNARLSRLTWLGGLMAGLIVLAFASLLWSHDRSLCLRRLIAFGLSLIGMLGVARSFTWKELCFVALGTSLACVLIGLGCELALGTFRPWSDEYRFSGTVHPNTQGAYLATAAFSALSLSVADAPRRNWYWAILAAAVVLLVLTKSRTSTIGVLASLGMVLWLLSSTRVRLVVPVATLFLAVSGMLVLLISDNHAEAILAKVFLLGREDQAESFSGRTTIWPVVQQYIDKRFWLGYGFESFWTPPIIEDVTAECEWPVREAHSAYREMLLSLGLIGLLLYVGVVVVGMIAALLEFRASRDACALFVFGMILNGLFNGMFESGMSLVSLPTFMIATGVARLALFHVNTAASHTEEAWLPRPNLSLAGGTT